MSIAARSAAHYDADESLKLVPLLVEVLRFPTVAGNTKAREDQQAWLRRTATSLGFVVRDAGLITEIELPGPPNAPVLGLAVHGDVQPVEESHWSFPPFAGTAKDGEILGRGVADDKGPLVQALLAMHALRESGAKLTHTIRLLVGSDEESGSTDITAYLKTHEPPALTLVLDAAFPVIVGEKAWNSLTVSVPTASEHEGAVRVPYAISKLDAGLGASIVPDQATLELHWRVAGKADWAPLTKRLTAKRMSEGTRLELVPAGDTLTVRVHGHSAHSGVNIEGGRNALVSLARVVDGELPSSGLSDMLVFARIAGENIYGDGLGLTTSQPIWGRYAVNVALVRSVKDESVLTINVRRTPPLSGPELKTRLDALVTDFDTRTGASLKPGGFYDDEPLVFDPESKIVKRLLAAYARGTGKAAGPAISGGGTYAKRLPRAIAFGMWFPETAYPGHDVDERVKISDLHRGVHVLLEALGDLATAPPIDEPFKP